MDSYSSIPSLNQQQQQQQQQQQVGYSNNPLVIPTNTALLQQQAQTQQYANNFGSQHSMNQRVLNTGMPQQQQQIAMERNYGAMGNPNLQQMRGLGGEGGNNVLINMYFKIASRYLHQRLHQYPRFHY